MTFEMICKFDKIGQFSFVSGRKILMRVDDYEPQITSFDISLKSSGDAQFNSITHLYIGKNETMREGFVGCELIYLLNYVVPIIA